MLSALQPELLPELLAAQSRGEAVVLATVVKARGATPRQPGAKMLVYADGRLRGTIGGGEMEARVVEAARGIFTDGKPRVVAYTLVDPAAGDPGVCGGEMEVFLELYLPPPTVFVVGCGHVGRAVAELAHWLGYRVVVTDDREELVSAENIPHADVYLPGPIELALARHRITDQTYITVVTRNVNVDRQVLPHLVQTAAPFIGVIGSRRRWEITRRRLLEDGMAEAELARCHSPLGLELNAETPEEIAVSILAEIIMLRRQGSGERMSRKPAGTESA